MNKYILIIGFQNKIDIFDMQYKHIGELELIGGLKYALELNDNYLLLCTWIMNNFNDSKEIAYIY